MDFNQVIDDRKRKAKGKMVVEWSERRQVQTNMLSRVLSAGVRIRAKRGEIYTEMPSLVS